PAHIGLWWDREGRRLDYPLTEQRPRLEPLVEEFKNEGRVPSFTFQVGGSVPAPSLWFLAEDRTELLQIQDDRFTRNWSRREGAGADYPSYGTLLPRFEADFRAFSEFVATEGLGEVAATQVELTYVNPIRPVAGVWASHGDISH